MVTLRIDMGFVQSFIRIDRLDMLVLNISDICI